MIKRFRSFEIKDAAKGEVSAVFSTFNVVDLDGDVTLPDAFENGADVVISAYGHRSHAGALPVGRGTIRTTKTEAIMDGRFFLETADGRDTFTVVRELGPLQEWSYSLHDVEAESGEFEGAKVRFLKKIRVKETSPVLLGAGINTRTVGVKGSKAWAEMAGSYEEKIEALRAAVEADLMPDDLAEDEYAYVSIQGTFTDRVVATLRRTGVEPVTYQYSWTMSADGAVGVSDRIEVELSVVTTEKDQRFADHSARVLAGVEALHDRADALAALRVKEGRVLSTANRDRLKGLAEALRVAASGLDEMLAATEPPKQGDLARQLALYQRSLAQMRSSRWV